MRSCSVFKVTWPGVGAWGGRSLSFSLPGCGVIWDAHGSLWATGFGAIVFRVQATARDCLEEVSVWAAVGSSRLLLREKFAQKGELHIGITMWWKMVLHIPHFVYCFFFIFFSFFTVLLNSSYPNPQVLLLFSDCPPHPTRGGEGVSEWHTILVANLGGLGLNYDSFIICRGYSITGGFYLGILSPFKFIFLFSTTCFDVLKKITSSLYLFLFLKIKYPLLATFIWD